MYKKVFLVLLFGAVFSSLYVAGEDKPVVIAIPPFCDFSTCEPAVIMSLRDKITANLLQNYSCVILSRSNGLALSTENKLNVINKIEQAKTTPVFLPGADYALVGYFKVARRTPGKKYSVDLGCTLLVTDLHNNKQENFKKIEFIPDEPTLYAADVTREIVKVLKLKPRKREYQKQIERIDETWAVLPIKRLESKQAMKLPADRDLAVNMELSLQQSGKLKQIVDHNEIDKVLQELKLSSLSNSTEGVAGSIAKLIGADKVIMGSVSKVHLKKPELRVDLFLVDGKTGVIIDSITGKTLPSTLNETVSDLVIKFTDRKHEIPELEPGKKSLMEKEALLYKNMLWHIKSINNDIKYSFLSEFTEIICLLAQDNYKIRYEVANRIVYDYSFSAPKDKKQIIIKLVDSLLSGVKESLKYPRVIYYKAVVRMGLDSMKPEAIRLYKLHLDNNFDKNKKHNSVVHGYISFCQDKINRNKNSGFYEKKLEYEKKNGLRINQLGTYREMDKESFYEEEFKLLLWAKKNTLSQISLLRLVQLTHYLKGSKLALVEGNEISGSAVCCPEYQLELAKIYFKLGDKQSAAMVLEGIKRQKLIKSKWFKGVIKKKQIKEFDDLTARLKLVEPQWKKLTEVMDITDKYKIYLQPVGSPNMKLIKSTIPLIEENLGFKVKLMPGILPLPEDKYVFEKDAGKFQAIHLLERLQRVTKVPKDAISVVYVTDKHIFTACSTWGVYFAEFKGAQIVSYHKLYYHKTPELVKVLAKNICTTIAPLFGPYCKISKCLFSYDDIGIIDVASKKFAICIPCQIKLKSYSEDKIYKRFQSLNRILIPYNTSSTNQAEGRDSVKLQQIYNEIVKKAYRK